MQQTIRRPDSHVASLYVLRLICVFMIVMIHFPTAGAETYMPLLRTAVPIFFMTSGYFTYSPRRDRMRTKLRRSFVKILWLTFYSNLIFACLKILMAVVGGDAAVAPLSALTTPLGWIRLIFIGNTILEYLWYLTAYLETLAAFMLFFRFRAERALMWLVPLFLLSGLLLGKYSFLLGMPRSPALWIGRNFLTLGLPFFCIGHLIRRNERMLSERLGRYAAPGIAVFLIAVLAEGRMLASDWRLGDIYIFTTPLAVSAFLVCVGHKDFGAGSWFDRAGERHALNIYLFQSIVAGVLIGGGKYLFGSDVTPYAAPAIFLGSLMLSAVINRTHRMLRR